MRSRWPAVALGVLFAAGMFHFFGIEFATGDVYPEFSSLRADARGARLLYESLERLPGLAVSRNFLPPGLFDAGHATVLLLGADPQTFGGDIEDIRQALRLTKHACRVVVAFGPYLGPGNPPVNKLNREWDIRLAQDGRILHFSRHEGWTTLREHAGHAMAVERAFDSGTVLLLASASDFDNQSTASIDRLDSVLAALGPNRRIVFDETHFGIQQSGTIVGLARRFRLAGAGLALIGCALLWVWRAASSFPPPAPLAAPNRLSGRASSSGLLNLLRRHVPASEIAAVCWKEWASVNRRGLPEGADAVLRSAAAPLDKMRQLHALVAPKGRS